MDPSEVAAVELARREAVPGLSAMRLPRGGFLGARVVVSADDASPEALDRLSGRVVAPPALVVQRGAAAIDVRLTDLEGGHVKSGTVLLEGPTGAVTVPIDPRSRRFRATGLTPGEYELRAASATSGQASTRLTLREDDVTRAVVPLDGRAPEGTTTLRLRVGGSDAQEVRIRATDVATGKVVFDKPVALRDGVLELDEFPIGRFHFDLDNGTARSCYDEDVTPLFPQIEVPVLVELIPWKPQPDPPPWRIPELDDTFNEVSRVFPALGINTVEDLAAAEPEGLMHLVRDTQALAGERLDTRSLANAVDAARIALGTRAPLPGHEVRMHLRRGESGSQAVRAFGAGDAELEVDLGPGNRAELRIERPDGVELRTIEGRELLRFGADDDASRVSLVNVAEEALHGVVRWRIPDVISIPTYDVWHTIEQLLAAYAVSTPGLSASIPSAIKQPENIDMWLDRARSVMLSAGVCSMNDLGRLRFDPVPILGRGAYVAPAKPTPLGGIPVLGDYAFESLIGEVLHYIPNQVLHESAIVLAAEWDIRGQTIVIGREVRELLVIAQSIRHDAGSRITWERPPLPNASAYWPNPAAAGDNGSGPGEHGHDGAAGDGAPHPSKNGGGNAVKPAPIITMWLLDATANLPPVDLRGQDGGTGGRGQDGGRGGDGDCGRRASGTFFGGCCRGVGFGGNGGRGGDGGRGGTGGAGGQGGAITILTTAPGIATLAASPPAIDVNPGAGGGGGPGGNPGPGGAGGPAGTADCEPWCDEHPERRGTDGATGNPGSVGTTGNAGPVAPSDAIQFLPITQQQWEQELNNPHIFDLNPDAVEPGQAVQVTGHNFDPTIDHVFFDGADMGSVSSPTTASFVVPLTTDGGHHPVVVRPLGVTDRRSNREMLQVLPKVDAIAAGARWIEGQAVTLTGLAFAAGAQVFAEDRSGATTVSYNLPVTTVTRTQIHLTIGSPPLGDLRGVRRIVVRNPDGGESRDERVARISDTIVVNCAAFRVVGTSGGGTVRTAAEVSHLFAEGGLFTVSVPWGTARIAFKLVQPVGTLTVADDIANLWPIIDNATDTNAFTNAPGVLGALNFFFVRDVELATAYAYFGGGPILIGDETDVLGTVDFQQVVAHEIGHALCLRHICDGAGEGPGTFFNRDCEDGDEQFLMYPFWDTSDGMAIHTGQVPIARNGASYLEQGKMAPLAAGALFQSTVPARCGTPDTAN